MLHPKDLLTIKEVVAWWRQNKSALMRVLIQAQRPRDPKMLVAGQIVKIGKADANILKDTSGTVSVWKRNDSGTLVDTTNNITAHLDWMHGDEQVSLGKEVLCTWFADEGIWRITGAECE